MPGTNLTREEARERATLIDVDRYDVALHLGLGATTFGSTTTVAFGCRRPGATTFIDLIAESVESITLNGVTLDPATHYADSRITLPELAEQNTLTVAATCRYMRTGEGLHRFVDPVDDEVYLYSQFEVADSRRMFTVFEQPDLKAAFAFTVTAPARWQVISAMPTPTPTPAGRGTTGVREEDLATWAFEATPRISSYITSMHAGPYVPTRDHVNCRAGQIPLGVFARASLAQHLDADNILSLTKKGFHFFEKEFDRAYPFAKYDQVIAPEYNMGAMENAGSVTISEIYLFRSVVPDWKVERRGLTILHELAHMWFGDLVTMRWWDDLWLNESFAEWASTTCQVEATDWRAAWTTFSIHEKSWAYTEDQRTSTHPIAADMRHIEDVETNFDGITYAKGASVLKQLVAWVGRDAFTAGLRRYFAKHAWGNTTLQDLLSELEETSGRDLSGWSQVWLNSSGVTTLRPELTVGQDGRYAAVAVRQSAPAEHPVLRPHRLGIGLYDVDGEALVRRRYVEVDVDGELTDVPELVGEQQSDLFLLNDEDLAYAMTRLDERSLATALAYPRGYPTPLPAAVVVNAAWDMVRSGELAARDYVDLALRSLPGQDHSPTVRILLGTLTQAVLWYVAPQARAATRRTVVVALRELAEQAAPGSDAQHQLLESYAALVDDVSEATYLAELLDGQRTLPGLQVDVELQWVLLRALASLGQADQARIDAQSQRDATLVGQERLAQTLAARPTVPAKEEAWQRAVVEDGASNAMVQALGHGFVRTLDPQLLAGFLPRYFDALTGIWRDRTNAIAGFVTESFYPHPLMGPELLDATQSWLTSHPDAPAGLVRIITDQLDECRRAVRGQQLDAQRAG